MTLKRGRSLVGDILQTMHPDVTYTVEALAAEHYADPKLVRDIVDMAVKNEFMVRVDGGVRAVKQQRRRTKHKQVDWVGRRRSRR